MCGDPQSRPNENDQSSVAISPTAPAARARSILAAISSRPPTQYIWKNVRGLAASTSSTGLEANDDRLMTVPRAAAARATATSPSGCTACTPVGEISTGSEISWPITVVAISRVAGSPATCGANPSSENAATLSLTVTPASAPATSAPYTDGGSRRFARRCATATVSNHLLAMVSRARYSAPLAGEPAGCGARTCTSMGADSFPPSASRSAASPAPARCAATASSDAYFSIMTSRPSGPSFRA